jgi:hypothetical protein
MQQRPTPTSELRKNAIAALAMLAAVTASALLVAAVCGAHCERT